MKEVIQENDPSLAKLVAKVSNKRAHVQTMKKFIAERPSFNARNVESSSDMLTVYLLIRLLTLEKGHTNARYVIKITLLIPYYATTLNTPTLVAMLKLIMHLLEII